ncbi:nucleosome assembly protein [Calycina marina]|uniref:Nucleosome assembly protein n=1 Tax=Calycina marina TaxID=1763456 RepID=A0A9P8CCN4_9HELO|nr:nucleosome assembly protein [Calycina marina]
MADEQLQAQVAYEDLQDLQREFDEVETEIMRQQAKLTATLYERRAATVAQIPRFWPLVLEQAPPDIDQYIQPSDSALLLLSLTSISVSRFELDVAPQSLAISFTFAPNEYFTNDVLQKKFWYRKAMDGWSGLVSEPVRIDWKKGKDLTGGLLDLVIKAWEQDRGKVSGSLSAEQKSLSKKIENTGMGGASFFAWFGFVGRRISAEESVEANKIEAKAVADHKAGIQTEGSGHDHGDQEDEDLALEMSLEIFPDGDDLAVAFAEDLWPGALGYFSSAQEQDAMSDFDMESDDEAPDLAEKLDDSESDTVAPPLKKHRSQ